MTFTFHPSQSYRTHPIGSSVTSTERKMFLNRLELVFQREQFVSDIAAAAGLRDGKIGSAALFFPQNWELNILRKVTVRPRWAALSPKRYFPPSLTQSLGSQRRHLRPVLAACRPLNAAAGRTAALRPAGAWVARKKKRKVCSLQPPCSR